MKVLPIALISFSMFAATGCSQVTSSTKSEASDTVSSEVSKPVARSGFNWKWVAGIVAVGLIVNELQDDDSIDDGPGNGAGL